ncbi:MAG: hypothetical protein CMH44_14610 [Muricauda sp.]|nr:hypothetical protein [uncultured Allomuricauda sp.]MAO18080.1 hypothetical protein [Allomuricauda sp.]MBC71211.1 hypothetical protein [Allomuricauda sp.]
MEIIEADDKVTFIKVQINDSTKVGLIKKWESEIKHALDFYTLSLHNGPVIQPGPFKTNGVRASRFRERPN